MDELIATAADVAAFGSTGLLSNVGTEVKSSNTRGKRNITAGLDEGRAGTTGLTTKKTKNMALDPFAATTQTVGHVKDTFVNLEKDPRVLRKLKPSHRKNAT